MEGVTDPKQGRNRDGPPRLDPLPMPRREPERDHVLLAVALFLAEVTDSLSQRAEESLLIYHA